ncbi:squamosa promoter-binding 8 [Chlorella sorokiniana]|uniref:Squamosa promoter-binding 8 n=1 Tax=Chlorella sorokiniana TaxID=3076 RepID=A0A2P6TEU4_CHLSO|nr:squamosa promoter-binding 8 [Chlorella sorokiniana]|eukprot:PRW32487.1 squamosa promoter-binding 8 [Chlorella sorokiniana]
MDPRASWLQSSYDWGAASLEARPAQAAKEDATANQPRRAAAICQVEGCGADLSQLRYFFRKQRICEQHARADVVTDAAGRQLRFCQQCTRLEPLDNFTVGRRSCKASLAKRQARAHRGKAHSSPDSSPERNRRRAKGAGPKRQAVKPSSSWSDEDSATAGSGNGSKGSRRSAGGPASKRSRGSSPSFDAAPSHAGGRSPGLQSAAFALPSDSPAVVGPPASLGSSGRRNSDSLADASQLMMPPQQDAAAAMQWQQHQLGAAGVPQQAAAAAAAAPQAQAQAQAQAQQQGEGEGMDWCQYLAADELEELLAIDPDMLADTLLANGGSTGPPSNGSGQASLVSNNSHWPPGPAAAAQQPLGPTGQAAMWGGVGPAAVAQQLPPQGMGSIPMPPQLMQALAVPTQPGPVQGPGLGSGPQLAFNPAAGATGYAGASGAGSGPAASLAPATLAANGMAGPAGSWGAQPAAMQAAALQQQAGGVVAAAANANPAYTMARFSLKIFGVAPEDLPPSLRAEMFAALQVSPTVLEGAIRCGCTHLIVDLLLTREEASQVAAAPRLAAAVHHLRRPDQWARLGAPPAMVAQLNSMIALGTAAAEQGGATPLPCIHLQGAQLLPALALDCPVATTTSASAGKFQLPLLPAAAGGRGQRSTAELATALHCRSHGRLVGTAVSVLRPSSGAAQQAERAGGSEAEEGSFSSDAELDEPLGELSDGEEAAAGGEAAAGDQPAVLQAWAPDALKPELWGLYEFELSSGSLLSEAVPVLVLPDEHADVAAELCQLQAEEAAGRVAPGTTAAVVRLVAAVLRFLREREAAEAAGAGSPAAAALETAYPPPVAMRLASAACNLVVFSVAACWPQLAALVLPAVTASGGSPAAAAQQMAGLSAPARSPLHLAVASGSAPTVAALRGWAAGHGLGWEALQPASPSAAGGGGSWAAAEEEAALDDLMLLAAAMGGSLDGAMVQQLTELLGTERLARSADAAGPGGWSPRRVAQATDNAALLAVLPPEPAATSSAAAVAAAAAAEEEEEEEEEDKGSEQRWEELQAAEECSHLQVRPEKLAALEEEWAASKAAAAAAGGKGWPARPRRRRRAPPSHDAALLASLMEEMHVGSEEQQPAAQPALERQASGGLTAQLVKTSLAGAAAAVVAALATVAVRLTLMEG